MVFADGRWQVFATTVNASGNYSMEYLDFADWSKATTTRQFYLDQSAIGPGYRAAPEIFYFRPQHMWYLVYQTGNASYSTNRDIDNPAGVERAEELLPQRTAHHPTEHRQRLLGRHVGHLRQDQHRSACRRGPHCHARPSTVLRQYWNKQACSLPNLSIPSNCGDPASPRSGKPDDWVTAWTDAWSRSTATSPTRSKPASKPLKQAWLDARHTITSHPAPLAVTPRTGHIRRQLADTAPRRDRQELPTLRPDNTAATSDNTVNHRTTGDRIWGTAPHIHPTFDHDHNRK